MNRVLGEFGFPAQGMVSDTQVPERDLSERCGVSPIERSVEETPAPTRGKAFPPK